MSTTNEYKRLCEIDRTKASADQLFYNRGLLIILIENSLRQKAHDLWNHDTKTRTVWTSEFKSVVEQIGFHLNQTVSGYRLSEKGFDLSWCDGKTETLRLESEWDDKNDGRLYDFEKLLVNSDEYPLSLGIFIFNAEDLDREFHIRYELLNEAYNRSGCKREILLVGVEGNWRYEIKTQLLKSETL